MGGILPGERVGGKGTSSNYRAALRVAGLSGRSASSRRRRASRPAFPRWSVRNDHLNYRAALRVACLSGRCASSFATQSVETGDAERRDLHSHAGACGTIISTIVRRSALPAFLDAARPLLRRRASRPAFPRWSVRNDDRNYRASLRVACLSGRSASSWRFRAKKLVTLSLFPRTRSEGTFRASDDSRMNTWVEADTPSPNLKSLTS
ncbi:hypothetical protein PsyrB_19170 [Pseudomonas syringae pv. syringae B301D]|nr:hypothetical protein PsyrB_19170 [Pseudomonas syringae pv. syringae B301D]